MGHGTASGANSDPAEGPGEAGGGDSVAEIYERVRTRADRLEVRYPSPAETETDPEREPDRRSPTQTTDVDPASSPD